MDMNTSTFQPLPEPRFAPQLLLQAALLSGLRTVLVSDFYSLTAFSLPESSQLNVIPGLTVLGHSRCAGGFLRLQLLCRGCSSEQLSFCSLLVELHERLLAQALRAFFTEFGSDSGALGTFEVAEAARALPFLHPSQISEIDALALCRRFAPNSSCGGDFVNPVQYDDSPLLEDLIAGAARRGFQLVLEKSGNEQCNDMYRFLGVQFFQCAESDCVRGSNYPEGELSAFRSDGNERLAQALKIPQKRPNRRVFVIIAVVVAAATAAALK